MGRGGEWYECGGYRNGCRSLYDGVKEGFSKGNSMRLQLRGGCRETLDRGERKRWRGSACWPGFKGATPTADRVECDRKRPQTQTHKRLPHSHRLVIIPKTGKRHALVGCYVYEAGDDRPREGYRLDYHSRSMPLPGQFTSISGFS